MIEAAAQGLGRLSKATLLAARRRAAGNAFGLGYR